MAQKQTPHPTDAELAILRVLWDCGDCTVREVNEALNESKPTGYTTTLKIMQIMAGKGLLLRDDSGFRHVFRPAISEEDTQDQIVTGLVDRAFAGSAGKLVMRALSAKKITEDELARIRKLIDEMGGTGK